MSIIVQKWKKAFKCVDKNPKGSLINNDYLEPFINSSDEFKFEKKIKTENFNDCNENTLINELNNGDYDNLLRPTMTKSKSIQNHNNLKDSTNMNKSKDSKKDKMKPVLDFCNIKSDENNNYAELYNNNNLILIDSNTNIKENNLPSQLDEIFYCEIQDSGDEEPLINLKKTTQNTEQTYNKLKLSDAKMNLFNKFEINNQKNDAKDIFSESLTDLRALNTFKSHSEAFHWFLNLVSDRMSICVKNDKNINGDEKSKRFNIITAHLLYARNYYEIRINNSSQLKTHLSMYHPCLIALACLLDSDAIRIVGSHSCSCDTYIYLFSTRLKICAWKAKMFIILKRPKCSSYDRLNLIEDLKNCHKVIQDK